MNERKVDGWIDDLVGALFDPIIVMPGGWGDDLPEWLRTRVKLERLIENMQALNEHRELTATDAEADCYLFTASLTAPIGSDWTQVYMYLVGMETKYEMKTEMPKDLKVETLTESQWRDLRQLKTWIYQQRVKHRKERQRGEHAGERHAKQASQTREELADEPVQPAFF